VWKGASTGHSRASYEGLIKIVPGAQESHTYLQTHSLMLSPKAKVDAIPSLIVETDSVSASHGGTVGEVDENQVFYMQSRGLSRQDAVRVIVEGYFEPIVIQLEDDALEALVRERISAKLAAAAEDIEAYAAAR
jgi:Fe-S cluster assembly scaffold protein SufB